MSLDKPLAQSIDASGHRYLIVAARFNGGLVGPLLERVRETLLEAKAPETSLCELRVPGSWEVPFAIQCEVELRSYDCAIALGMLIRGETLHFQHIAQSVSDALQMVSLNCGLPVINGIVVAEDRSQAEARAMGEINRGKEFAEAALAMAALKREREALK